MAGGDRGGVGYPGARWRGGAPGGGHGGGGGGVGEGVAQDCDVLLGPRRQSLRSGQQRHGARQLQLLARHPVAMATEQGM